MARVRVKDTDEPNQTAVMPNDSVGSKSAELSRFISKKSITVFIIAVLVAGVIVGLMRDRNQLKDQLQKTDSNQSAQTSEPDQLKAEIGQYLALPDETPVVTNIQDVTKFKDQAFFKNAQNGDKLLLFAESGRVVLYRPSTKKVIEFTSFSTGQNPSDTTRS